MSAAGHDPYGAALREFTRGNAAAVLEKRYANGVSEPIPVTAFFREPDHFAGDARALEHCRGRILDVGAGCGQHARHLERAGYQVTAIDVLPEAVRIMRDLGLSDVRKIDFFEMPSEKYDTVLFLVRTIGFAGTPGGLGRAPGKCRELLASSRQVLLTSWDVARSAWFRGDEIASEVMGYRGEIRFRFVYAGIAGEEMRWLHIDPQTLSETARRCGVESELLCDEGDGDYSARLSLIPQREHAVNG